jgi:hypothetical protein
MHSRGGGGAQQIFIYYLQSKRLSRVTLIVYLDTVQTRQKVAQTFASEIGNPSQPDSIHNWYQNNKPKKSKEGECAGAGSKTW